MSDEQQQWFLNGHTWTLAVLKLCGVDVDEAKMLDTLRHLLGDAFIAVEIPSNDKKDHSVLTEQRHEPSIQRVLQFLKAKLV